MRRSGSTAARRSRFEALLFASRWLLAPFFVGLIVTIALLLVRFLSELRSLAIGAFQYSSHEVVVTALTLVDIALIACLLLIIAFSGYEIFVSRIDMGEGDERPLWLEKIGFTDLKSRLLGALVSIAAVELLKGLFNLDQYTNSEMAWKTGVLLAFSVAATLFAFTDRIAHAKYSAPLQMPPPESPARRI